MRTDREIVKQTEELARTLAETAGIYVKTPDYSFRNSDNTQLKIYWVMACESQKLLTNTDPDDCEDESDLEIILEETFDKFQKIATESGLELSEVLTYWRQQNAL